MMMLLFTVMTRFRRRKVFATQVRKWIHIVDLDAAKAAFGELQNNLEIARTTGLKVDTGGGVRKHGYPEPLD